MKILFIGVFNQLSTNISQSRGLKNNGCKVIEYDYRIREQQVGKIKRDKEIINICNQEKPTLVLFSKCDEVDSSVLVACKKIAKVALWYMDPMENWTPKLEMKIMISDYVFCALETPLSFSKKINNRSLLLYEGFDNLVDYPIELDKKYDVSFIGSLKGNRQQYYEKRKFILIQDAYGTKHREQVAKSKINLNFVVNNEGISDRVYKILAAKGFLLTQPWPNMYEYFEPGKDFIVFNGYNDYTKLIKYYLKNEKKREKIAEQGYKSVQKYNRDNWARELLCKTHLI